MGASGRMRCSLRMALRDLLSDVAVTLQVLTTKTSAPRLQGTTSQPAALKARAYVAVSA